MREFTDDMHEQMEVQLKKGTAYLDNIINYNWRAKQVAHFFHVLS